MNSFEGNGMCDISEYDNHESRRLSETDLRPDELYLFMLALKGEIDGKGAVRKAVRVAGKACSESGIWAVRVKFLDDHFKTECEVDSNFQNGFWLNPEIVKVANVPPQAGYFRGYEDSFDDEFRRMADSMQLVATD